MHWSAYETFSVISGIALLGVGLLAETSTKDRLWALLGGAAFVAYGFYVAAQDSGTYYFPVAVFVLPFALAIAMGVKALDRRQRSARPALPPARATDGEAGE
jgi:peptidoglycan/LPS O-acetylase OafA/YrhL